MGLPDEYSAKPVQKDEVKPAVETETTDAVAPTEQVQEDVKVEETPEAAE